MTYINYQHPREMLAIFHRVMILIIIVKKQKMTFSTSHRDLYKMPVIIRKLVTSGNSFHFIILGGICSLSSSYCKRT